MQCPANAVLKSLIMYQRYVKQLGRRFCNFLLKAKTPCAAGSVSKGAGKNISEGPTAIFSGPNPKRRTEIDLEAKNLYPNDQDKQKKYMCAKFWSEVRLDRVENP